MNSAVAPDNGIPASRAYIAKTLAGYYAELSDLDESKEGFSVADILRSNTDKGLSRGVTGYTREICEAASMSLGQLYDGQRTWIPLRALQTRAMATTPGSKGGFLAGVDDASPVDVLRPWSVTASAGVNILTGLTANLAIPRTSTATSATWISENATAPAESPPSLGLASLTQKTAIATVKFSLALLRQADVIEDYLRQQLLRAAGELLDKAVLNGAGGAEPIGLLQTPGIGSQSGSSLADSGIRAMKKAVLNAGAVEQNLTWIATPTVQEVLSGRERASGGGQFLWGDGTVLGQRAFATKNAPASALIVGDFSQATVGVFGPGLRLDVDPSQSFNSGELVARVLLIADCCFPQAGAFAAATSVT